jgi:hypothetical protein
MRRARIPSAANKGVLSAIFALSFVIMAGDALIPPRSSSPGVYFLIYRGASEQLDVSR